MKDSRKDSPLQVHVAVITAALLGAFLAVWILDFGILRSPWCGASRAECFREWVSASSGWAAAVGALAAAFMTLRPLREQVTEARKQTNFIVGDTLPELVMRRDAEAPDSVELLVENLNRRDIFVVGIREAPSSDFELVGWAYSPVPGAGRTIRMRDEGFGKAELPGWRERNAKPPVLRIRMHVQGADDRQFGDLRVIATVGFDAAEYRSVELQAETFWIPYEHLR